MAMGLHRATAEGQMAEQRRAPELKDGDELIDVVRENPL
jgi:hypothetical protein